MNDLEIIKNEIMDSANVKNNLTEKDMKTIFKISKNIMKILKNNGTIFLCGNGGSAADAQHVAAEFVGRFEKERKALPAEALTTNTSILTAIGNDYDFTKIFSRQVSAKVSKKDIVIGISTSGKSKNVLEALKTAKKIGATTIGFTGNNTNMDKTVDICLKIPSNKTSRIQESHIMIWHIICKLIEKQLKN